MKKQTFTMALMAMMFASATFVGCSKNYDTEIDQLKTDVAANKAAIESLQAAMAKGLMVSKVEVLASGYKLTMTDGTMLNLNHGKDGLDGIQGPNGEKGDPAITPQMRVSAAKNWEMSIDGGATWAEIKDVDGNAIADAKNFVKDNITVNEEGNIVIGDKITGYSFDITVPSIVLVPQYCYMVVTAPAQNGDGQITGIDVVYVPTEGYFDQWSVNSIMAAKSTAKEFKIIGTELAADATINGVEYSAGDVLFSSAGVDVILNPSNIDAQNIEFKFVAALAGGELYDMPIELQATPSTKGISTIVTKSAATAVWTINLAGATSVGNLLGNATDLAISAENNYGQGVRTMSEYGFSIVVAEGSSSATPSGIVVEDVHAGKGALVAAPANVVASALYVAEEDKGKIEVYFENGAKVDTKDGEFEDYTGNYIVRQVATPAGRSLKDAPSEPVADVEYILTYNCIGADGVVAENDAVKVKFVGTSSVFQAYVIPEALKPTGTDLATELTFTQVELLDAIYGKNTVDRNEFLKRGFEFDIELEGATLLAGISVEFLNAEGEVVEDPEKAVDFASVKITVPQTAFFAQDFTATHSAKIVFRLEQATPSTYTLAFRVNFTLDGTLEVTKVTHKAVTVPNTEAGVEINLADFKLFSGEDKDVEITTSDAVLSLTMLDNGLLTASDFADDLELEIKNDGGTVAYFIKRVNVDAPAEVTTNANVTLTGVDAWGQSFTTEVFTVTIAAAEPSK